MKSTIVINFFFVPILALLISSSAGSGNSTTTNDINTTKQLQLILDMVSGIKVDISGIKVDIGGLKIDIKNLNARVDSVGKRVDRVGERMNESNKRIVKLDEGIIELNKGVDKVIKKRTTDKRMLGSQRDILTAVIFKIFFGGVAEATGHAVAMNGIVARIFSPHADYSHLPADELPDANQFIFHKHLDFAILKGCPEEGTFALNISVIHPVEIGDELAALGYGTRANFWSGIVGRVGTGIMCDEKFIPWGRDASFCEQFETWVYGGQHAGQSGAPAITRCGSYGGSPHVVSIIDGSPYTAVIPAEEVQNLILEHIDEFTACKGVTVVNAPRDEDLECVAYAGLPSPAVELNSATMPDADHCTDTRCSLATTQAPGRIMGRSLWDRLMMRMGYKKKLQVVVEQSNKHQDNNTD